MNIQPRFGSHFEVRFNKALPEKIATSSYTDQKVREWTQQDVWRGQDQKARKTISDMEFDFTAENAIRNIRNGIVKSLLEHVGQQTDRVMVSSGSGGATLEGDSLRDENLTGPSLEYAQIYLDNQLVAAVLGNRKGIDIVALDKHDDLVNQALGQAFKEPLNKWSITGQLGLPSSKPSDINKFVKTENLGNIQSDKQIANLGNKIALIIYRSVHGLGNLAARLWG